MEELLSTCSLEEVVEGTPKLFLLPPFTREGDPCALYLAHTMLLREKGFICEWIAETQVLRVSLRFPPAA